MSKPRLVKNYETLTETLVEQIKLVYPRGFSKHLVTFKNKEGKIQKGLPFETDDHYYLIRMSEDKAEAIVREDDDYDDNGRLRVDVKEDLASKYEEEDFLDEYNSNEDNDLGSVGDDVFGDD